MFALSLVLLYPCWILYPWCNNFSVLASVECWTCKWYFALILLACMSGCSFIVWMIIVVTIYSDCSCLVKPCFIVIFIIAWSHIAWLHCACSIYISRFLLTMNFLCYFFRKTCLYGSRASQNLELGVSEFWQLFRTHILSLEFILGFFHGITKGEDCKVEFIQSCIGFIPCQIYLHFNN